MKKLMESCHFIQISKNCLRNLSLQAKQEQGQNAEFFTCQLVAPLDYQNVLQMQQENGPTDNPTSELSQ